MLLTLTNSIQLQNQYNQSMYKMIMDMNLIFLFSIYIQPNTILLNTKKFITLKIIQKIFIKMINE